MSRPRAPRAPNVHRIRCPPSGAAADARQAAPTRRPGVTTRHPWSCPLDPGRRARGLLGVPMVFTPVCGGRPLRAWDVGQGPSPLLLGSSSGCDGGLGAGPWGARGDCVRVSGGLCPFPGPGGPVQVSQGELFGYSYRSRCPGKVWRPGWDPAPWGAGPRLQGLPSAERGCSGPGCAQTGPV